MLAIGSKYPLMEICHWYYNATRLCREHACGSPDRKDSAMLRQKEFGSYGHKATERAGWYRRE